MLLHVPRAYEDKTKIVTVTEANPLTNNLFELEITGARPVYFGRKHLAITARDATGVVHIRMYYITKDLMQKCMPGVRVRCYGKLTNYGNKHQIFHPELTFLKSDTPDLATSLTPLYPLTSGVSQTQLRRWIDKELQALENNPIEDLLPPELLSYFNLDSLENTLRSIHHPSQDSTQDSKHYFRIKVEELFAWSIGLQYLQVDRMLCKAPAIPHHANLLSDWIARLPFTLTEAQQKAIAEIASDTARPTPMMRILQGDVGCGKTAVATACMILCAKAKLQAVLLAPTEILAEQHALTLFEQCHALGISIVHLSGSLPPKVRSERLSQIQSGNADIIVGTHAVFSEAVRYHSLGLIIIDEQQRFGVEQRARLQEKQEAQELVPHQLIMSATPIPRTLALVVFGDLPITLVDQHPKGRMPITTVAVSQDRRGEVIERVRKKIQEGAQVYWVCPLIDATSEMEGAAVEEIEAELSKALTGITIGIIHGRVTENERVATMQKFRNNTISLLVATTIIEVGVDVPNACIMVIENSERLGLSQLHQLRGRIGRGSAQSYCILLYQKPLNEIASHRIETMRNETNGFTIALKDLELRGTGELLGVKQSGFHEFRVAKFPQDLELFKTLKPFAQKMIKENSEKALTLYRRWNDDTMVVQG